MENKNVETIEFNKTSKERDNFISNKIQEEKINNTFDLHKKNKKKKHSILIIILLTIDLLIVTYFINQKYNLTNIIYMNLSKSSVEIDSINLENNMINISFNKPNNMKKSWYKVLSDYEDITDWIEISEENKISANENIKYIKIKDEKNESDIFNIKDYLNVVYELNVKTTLNKIMLTQGETKELEIETKCIGNPIKDINISTNDESILRVENNTILALKHGKVNLIVSDNYGNNVDIPVTVTDLITLPEIKANKKFLTKANIYTEEEAHLLDELLDYKIKEAGEGTRAAVIAAAKFLTMEFKYTIPYFVENGRYQKNDFSRPCDGEGRYYHKGLYLSEDKYKTIKDSRAGPAMWGAPLMERSTNTIRYNGLDCSGFVSWALYNAGFDPGDIGAGPDENFGSLPGYGKEYDLTVEILKSRKN